VDKSLEGELGQKQLCRLLAKAKRMEFLGEKLDKNATNHQNVLLAIM
jgi:hypothetical protein